MPPDAGSAPLPGISARHPAASPDAEPLVRLERVSKTFGSIKAVDAVSLAIRAGEFFSLLGPSGCGKTTLLRLLAGLETPDPDGGTIFIAGERMDGKRPYERRLGMVFQHYALFPHLSVERNVAFGLEQRRHPARSIPERVVRALELVRLPAPVYARRMPRQLSGGERQRVALARALVLEPAILLLDEPLGAIDLKLRKQMQLELRQLNRALGITFLYVTHDQEEALTMSDRIAVMDRARLAQVGTPAEIYENPRTAFVAGFIGEANLVEARTRERKGARWEAFTAGGAAILLPDQSGLASGREVRLAIRPEWLDLFPPGAAPPEENVLPGTVGDVIYLGETIHVRVTLDEGPEVAVALRNEGQLSRPVGWSRGDRVLVGWVPEDCQLLEGE